ncbi:hypothetical protein KCP69_21280 [Salmonella enterica subsp. enterica]|nr:hypothetical protein KCP69_21280 [Salmonella enterica subsp. enterica]
MLKRILTFSVPSVGDGAAVVLSEVVPGSAKRAGTIAENRYPPDLRDGGILYVLKRPTIPGLFAPVFQSISRGRSAPRWRRWG